MNSTLKVDIILPPTLNEDGEIMKEEKVVKAYINFAEVLDYFEDSVETEEQGSYHSIINQIEEREITVVTYKNGYVRYVLIELSVFNSLYVKWKTSLDINTIRSKFN